MVDITVNSDILLPIKTPKVKLALEALNLTRLEETRQDLTSEDMSVCDYKGSSV